MANCTRLRESISDYGSTVLAHETQSDSESPDWTGSGVTTGGAHTESGDLGHGMNAERSGSI
eukprot:3542377-Prymnesium_polylepis.1